MDVDTSINFCGIKLPNPLILASGTIGERSETLLPYLNAGAGAVVTRTLRLKIPPEREHSPSPSTYIAKNKSFILNCEWCNSNSWHYWHKYGIKELSEVGTVILSISGRNLEDCVTLAKKFEKSGVSLFEINISCVHSSIIYGNIPADLSYIKKLIVSLKKAIKIPVMIKLGLSQDLIRIAQIAEKAGVDAVAATNSIGPGLDIDISTGRKLLGIKGGMGGVSGKAIFPLALYAVNSMSQVLKVPIMGIGGISNYQDVIKMLMVGAKCVQIYSAAFLEGPQLFHRIQRNLVTYLKAKQYKSLDELHVSANKYLSNGTNVDVVYPVIKSSRCNFCGKCIKICLQNAIQMSTTISIDYKRCSGCGACAYFCTKNAIALNQN
jgi:dihydroorotate dehydrogenase (NAD+) catalytic subunit